MLGRIQLEWSVKTIEVVKNLALRRAGELCPPLKSILLRFPENMRRRIFVHDYTVNERLVEKGFFFMQLAGEKPGASVLEVGCCESSMALEIASLGFRVWGIDIRDYYFAHPNLTFIKGSVIKTGFQDGFFDLVSAISTVEHIGLGCYGGKKVEGGDLLAVGELCRVLKPGGRLVLTVPYGLKAETELFRCYDKASLDALTKGFKVVNTFYSVMSGDRKYWRQCSESEAAGKGLNQLMQNEGNVCLCLQKGD